MKAIIFGATESGYLISKELHEKHDVVVIDREENASEEFGRLDVSFLNSNTASVKVLEAAGIRKADVFIACSMSDEANIVACWTAKRISNIETAAFIRKYEHIESLAISRENLADINIEHIIWPEQLLTQEILRIISVPDAIDVEVFANGRAKLFEYRISENSSILDKEIKNCYFPDGALIVGITREEHLFIPDGNTKLQLADKAIFMGTDYALNALGQRIFGEAKRTETATIIGGGSVGYMLAQNFEQLSIKTKLVEKNPQRCEFLADALKKTLILKGDGTNLELLESEDIGDSDVVISVTNNDEKNLLCSLLVKQLGVKRIITRVGKSSNVSLFEKVGIDVAISPHSAAIKELKNRLIERDIDILATVEQGLGEVIEISTGKEFQEIFLKDMQLPKNAIIGSVQRGYKLIVPKGDTLIKADDKMIIFTTADQAQSVKDFFK